MIISKAFILNGGLADTDVPQRIWSKVDLYQVYMELLPGLRVKILRC